MCYTLLFWTSLKDVARESARGSVRQYQSPLVKYHQKKINKTGTSGCGSFAVPNFQPATLVHQKTDDGHSLDSEHLKRVKGRSCDKHKWSFAC